MRSARANPVDPARERGILDAALSGDEAGFSALYRLYSTSVYAYTLKRVGDPSLAEDLSQEVFLQVHRSLKSFGGRSSLSCWILGIAHNVVSYHYRTCTRRRESPLASRMQDDIPLEAGTERRIDAVRALRRCEKILSKTQRPAHQRIFHLRYRESDSIRQIARRVGKSDGAVKVSLHRSRCALLDRIPELGQFLDTPTESAA